MVPSVCLPRTSPRSPEDEQRSPTEAGRPYGLFPAVSLRQTGQQAPSSLTGAGHSAGVHASTKQVTCPSWGERRHSRSVRGTAGPCITPTSRLLVVLTLRAGLTPLEDFVTKE